MNLKLSAFTSMSESNLAHTSRRDPTAFKAHERVVELKNNLTKDFLELGKALWDIYRLKYYLNLDYPSFGSYLASPEISFSQSSAYSLIDIYKTFLVQFKVAEAKLLPIGRRKLEMILPLVNDENYDDWLSKATALSTTDLGHEVKESQGKKTFIYKYSKEAKLAFNGDTNMEHLLESRTTLLEYHCGTCDRFFWISKDSPEQPNCPWETVVKKHETPSLNGEISYKDIHDYQPHVTTKPNGESPV